jgi:predicted TIM-barrel fold metal-dependent hydrolase
MTAAASYAQARLPQRRICDADSHLMETLDWLAGYADARTKARLVGLHLDAGGAMAEKAIAKAEERRRDPVATAELADNVIAGPKGWAAFGASTTDERKQALDRLGFARQFVFSTFAGSQFLRSDDADLKYGGARAHNRGMADFCGGDARMIPVGILPLEDPARAVAEVEAGLKDGCGAFWVAAGPAGDRSPGHPDLDPVWARLAEARAPFVLHIGQGTRTLAKALENNGVERPKDWLGGGENIRILDYMVLPHAPEMFLSAVIFHGVFSRHPNLMGGVVELGAGWVPSFLARLDLGARFFMKSDPQVQALGARPSEVARRHLRFTPFAGEDVGTLIRLTGPELYLFSSDFPHPEGGKDPIGKFEETLQGVGEDVRDAFYAGNFEALMGAR